MSEPKNKESREWRDWYVRHEILGSGSDLFRIAYKNGKDLVVSKQFIDDIVDDNA